MLLFFRGGEYYLCVGNLPQQVVFSLGQRACLKGDNQPQQIDSTGRKTAVASVPDSLGKFPYVAYQIGNPLSLS
jgi:hypothetical protein